MKTIDIREDQSGATRIRFAEHTDKDLSGVACLLESDGGVHISILDEDGDDKFVSILSAQHAKDMIKALEKAIDLGWVE